jgi:tetratricopeptide (TPR) repeat protein
MWFVIGAALAADPSVVVTWRRAEVTLIANAPAGEHIAPESPFTLELSDGSLVLERTGGGEELAHGVLIGDVRGHDLHGTLNLSLCEDAGTSCRMVDVRVHGHVGTESKGTTTWIVTSDEHLEDRLPFPSKVDANAAWTQGVADATALKRPMLLDFGAVWCPPCNLLAAEVLLAKPTPGPVADVAVVALDVDDPTSWTLKDRYHIGGYPTLVATDAEGRELGRLVGYPGKEQTLAWIDKMAHGGGTPASDPAQALWDAVRAGDTSAARGLLAAAEKFPDRVELRLGRFNLSPNATDALWLGGHAPGRAVDWVMSSVDLARKDPAVKDAVRAAITADTALAHGEEAATLLGTLAEIEDGAASQALYAASAALMRTRLTGDARLDKGLYTDLSWLLEHAGQADAAIAVLLDAQRAYPDEPTFFTTAGRTFLRVGRYAEALAAADEALAVSWGDNKLTAAIVKAKALMALDRKVEAKGFVDQILRETAVSPGNLDVRTPRYVKELQDAVRAP